MHRSAALSPRQLPTNLHPQALANQLTNLTNQPTNLTNNQTSPTSHPTNYQLLPNLHKLNPLRDDTPTPLTSQHIPGHLLAHDLTPRGASVRKNALECRPCAPGTYRAWRVNNAFMGRSGGPLLLSSCLPCTQLRDSGWAQRDCQPCPAGQYAQKQFHPITCTKCPVVGGRGVGA